MLHFRKNKFVVGQAGLAQVLMCTEGFERQQPKSLQQFNITGLKLNHLDGLRTQGRAGLFHHPFGSPLEIRGFESLYSA